MSISTNRRSAEHLELIFEIYSLIPTIRKITARELQLALSDKGITRSKRTIQRGLDCLLTYFDVEQDATSKPYGYRRTANSKLALGPREHMIFLWAEAYLKTLLPRSYHLMVDSAFAPFSTLSTKRKLIDIRQPVASCIKETSSMVFETLCTAVFYQREVRLSLINLPQSLYINPLGFIVEQGHLYLAYQYQNIFHAVLIDEVLSAYLTTFAYHYPNNFSLSYIPLSKKELT
ncbi:MULTISPECIES: hypothetical protein [Vibrio]|uniref:hypothetical protein n=1 Tax=Vibrio TaxID=662 RepID=UPI001C9BFDD7|nr:hypothetical protein [Vibrio anguillarum]MBY7668022.1 hypothetical protein [Vibrio anguillarum]